MKNEKNMGNMGGFFWKNMGNMGEFLKIWAKIWEIWEIWEIWANWVP